jgi:hypothetical protein
MPDQIIAGGTAEIGSAVRVPISASREPAA